MELTPIALVDASWSAGVTQGAADGSVDGTFLATSVYRQDVSRRDEHPVIEAVGGTALFLALVAATPGALATFVFEHALRVPLELGQRWTFASATSLVTAVGFCLRSTRGWDGFARYMLLSVATAAVLFVARFGFHAPWAAAFFAAFIP